MGYMPRAMRADSIKTITNVSGSYAGAMSPNNGAISFELGMLNINRAHTFKTFNVAYGLFGYLGTAKKDGGESAAKYPDDYLQPFNKSISGVGLRISTGFHHTSQNGNTDFRYLNWENAISTESGAYADFRKQIYDSKIPNYVAVSNRSVIWTTGISTEVIWRARRNHDIKHAFRLFIGGTPGLSSSFKYGTDIDYERILRNSGGWVANYFLYIKKFSLSWEVASNVNFAQKLSLGYTF